MKATPKKTTKKKQPVGSFQPGIIAFLIALIAVLSLVLLAYLGVILS